MDTNKTSFDYESHYKELISALTHILIDSIEKLPEADKDTRQYNTSYKNKCAENVRIIRFKL